MEADKQYLGDGVYAKNDEFGITLTTENGVRTSNTIFLEPVVFSALIEYEKRTGDRDREINKEAMRSR